MDTMLRRTMELQLNKKYTEGFEDGYKAAIKRMEAFLASQRTRENSSGSAIEEDEGLADEIKGSSISILGLTTRRENALRNGIYSLMPGEDSKQINTIGDLCELSEIDLLDIRGIGEEAIKSIKEALAVYRLSLAG